MRRFRMVIATVLALGALGSVAWAHSTGNERRTPEACKSLKGTGEVPACLECVARKEKHHYHPDFPAGDRCRPDDGKSQ